MLFLGMPLQEQVDLMRHSITVNITVAVVGLLIFGTLLLVVVRTIALPISETAAAIKHLAETGDLSYEVPPAILARRDEVGDMAVGINLMLDEFHDVAKMAKELTDGNWQNMIKDRGDLYTMNHDLNSIVDRMSGALHEINEHVKEVATGANEVSSTAQSLADGAQESAASLEQIAASMHEVSDQTKQNAASAGQARDLAQSASKAATDGQKEMHQMTEAMERITQNSSEIQRVIKVIDDIAFQTNLLALNAAVEAARAGQHGKGFAVVAEEVRNLASRSAKAAQETSELISKSGHEIERGGEVATRTAETLNTIVEQVKQTTDIVAGIAIASNEQAHAVSQITAGLQQIDAVTQQNTAAAEESASAASEMSGMAKKLQDLVAQFKLR
jgi:methyl-accepting chemotaxis protein